MAHISMRLMYSILAHSCTNCMLRKSANLAIGFSHRRLQLEIDGRISLLIQSITEHIDSYWVEFFQFIVALTYACSMYYIRDSNTKQVLCG